MLARMVRDLYLVVSLSLTGPPHGRLYVTHSCYGPLASHLTSCLTLPQTRPPFLPNRTAA